MAAMTSVQLGGAVRIFSGTYNVRGRPRVGEDGNLEEIPQESIHAFLSASLENGAPPPDIVAISLQELMELSALNVVVESIDKSPDHHARVAAWRRAFSAVLATFVPDDDTGKFAVVGQVTCVGLALLVFARRSVIAGSTEVQNATVQTGFGGMLGNKGSVMWRARVPALGGCSVCIIGSHFASGRGNVDQRHSCYDVTIASRPFVGQSGDHFDDQGRFVKGQTAPESPPAPQANASTTPATAVDGDSSGRRPSTRDNISRFLSNFSVGVEAAQNMLFGEEGAAEEDDSTSGPLDHDLVIWVGDFNYALLDHIDPVAARDMLATARSQSDAPPQVLQNADQLLTAKKSGRAFQGFDEGPLNFLPT